MTSTRRPRDAAALLALSVVAWLAVIVTYLGFVRTERGQLVEELVRYGNHVGQAPVLPRLPEVLALVSVSSLAVAMAIALVVGVLRARWRSGIAAIVIVAGATLSTEVLKMRILTRPDYLDDHINTLPSGHTTVAASVAVAAVLVAPRRLRPAVALTTAAYAIATGVATVVADWHRPSDVLSAYGVVLAWSAFVSAIIVTLWPAPAGAGQPDRAHRVTSLVLGSSALPLGLLSLVLLASTARNVGRPVGDLRRFGAYAGSLSGLTAACLVLMAIWLVVVPLIDDAAPIEDRADGLVEQPAQLQAEGHG